MNLGFSSQTPAGVVLMSLKACLLQKPPQLIAMAQWQRGGAPLDGALIHWARSAWAHADAKSHIHEPGAKEQVLGSTVRGDSPGGGI